MVRTVLTGPRHDELEGRALQLADEAGGSSVGSVLYVTGNDARGDAVADRWAARRRPLRLRVETHVQRCLAFRDQLLDGVDAERTFDELSVTARLDAGKLVGDVDFLAVTPDRYHVLDYKTNDTAGRSVGDVAANYWPQLRVYAVALHQHDPSKAVQLTLYFPAADESRTRSFDPASLGAVRDDVDATLRALTDESPPSLDDVRLDV